MPPSGEQVVTMRGYKLQDIQAGDELYIDSREATVEWVLGDEFCVTYRDGSSRTVSDDEFNKLVREEELDNEHRLATFMPYYGSSIHNHRIKTHHDFDEPMVAILRTHNGDIECVFNDTAIEQAHLPQYQYADLLVSDHPYVFAVNPVTESLRNEATIEMNHDTVNITQLAKEFSFYDFFEDDGKGNLRWLKAQWDELNEMFVIDASCLSSEVIINRKTNRDQAVE